MKETKVYVEELPKECWDCPCFKTDLECPCGLSDGTQDYFKDEIDGENCPLKLLKTHDRELVKKVCDKISNHFKTTCYISIDEQNIYDVLDQIQREFEK